MQREVVADQGIPNPPPRLGRGECERVRLRLTQIVRMVEQGDQHVSKPRGITRRLALNARKAGPVRGRPFTAMNRTA